MIKIENLSVAFDGTEVVKNVNLEITDGEILGIVGESGSGKSVTALTLMGLVSETAEVTSGRIVVDDCVLREAGKPVDKKLYRTMQGDNMSMIFQEPMTSLNPTQKVGKQVGEMLKLHTVLTKEEIKAKVLETFEAVGLRNPELVYNCYPHQLSGGMRQRVMIAMAVILHPDLVVADEPTTALDVSIQNQIVALLKDINTKENNSMIFITHDLNLARRICDRVAVMKDGRIVELGATEDIFLRPQESYTKNLMEAVPSRLKRRVSAMKNADNKEPIVQVKDLSVFYEDRGSNPFAKKVRKCIVKNATFDIYKGESLGLVGESGCGKTTLSKAILGMNMITTGEVIQTTVRPQMIFQDPYSSLNPSKTIGWLLQEPLRARGILDPSQKMTKADMEAAAYEMLKRVGLEEKYFTRKPSQLSGGQRQRISIGQALITRPGLIVADEPVSALDVTVQAQIMELMQNLQQEMELSYLFISHDINVVYKMCDRIMVMKEGQILEIGETEEIFAHPQNEYTQTLFRDSL
ncbi:MAG: ABC transporter ATP-binding protein [Acetatifactor sp.]|nr:ABC transporter ATP-binding protein [Acetatifactor sp.]